MESHVKIGKHRECLAKPGGSTISFLNLSKAQPVETSTLKQSNNVDVNTKQLGTKAVIMWSIQFSYQIILLTPFPAKVIFSVKCFLTAK